MNYLRVVFAGKQRIIIWSVVIFLFAFGIRCSWISQKAGIHVDEGLTHFISSYTGYNWSNVYDENIIYTGKDVKFITFKNKDNLKSSFSDIKDLRRWNDGDTAHTNLYYSVYRLWMTGGEALTLKEFINRGCGLNLIFFSISFFLMYKLLRKLFKDARLVPFGLAAAFLNTGSISNTLFIRPYQLQETLLILMTLVFVTYYEKIERKENIINWKDFIILSSVLGITILSAYFSLIYIGLLGLVLLYLSVRSSQNKNILFLSLTFLSGIAVALFTYNGYFSAFASDRASQVMSVAQSSSFVHNLMMSVLNLVVSYLHYIFYLPLVILLIVFNQDKFKKQNFEVENLSLTLIIISLIWSFVVMLVVPYKIIRYIVPVFPIISLIFPYIFSKFKNKVSRILIPLFTFVFIINSVFASSVESYESGLRNKRKPKLFINANIENLYLGLQKDCKFTEKPNLPVIFFNDDNNWRFSNIVPYFVDEQKYEFHENEDKGIYEKYKNFYVLYGVNIRNKKHDVPKGFVVTDKLNCGHFVGYELFKQ